MSRKTYLLTDADFDKLRLFVDRNPTHGYQGGSSTVLSPIEEKAHDEAHRFYNYQVHKWINEMSQ